MEVVRKYYPHTQFGHRMVKMTSKEIGNTAEEELGWWHEQL